MSRPLPKCRECKKHPYEWCHSIDSHPDRNWFCDDCGKATDPHFGFAHCGQRDCWCFRCHLCFRKIEKTLPPRVTRLLQGAGLSGAEIPAASTRQQPKRQQSSKRRKAKLPSLTDGTALPDWARAVSTTLPSLSLLGFVLADTPTDPPCPSMRVLSAAFRRQLRAATDPTEEHRP